MSGFLRIALMVIGIAIAIATGMYFFNAKAKKYARDLWADLTSKDDGCCRDDEVSFAGDVK